MPAVSMTLESFPPPLLASHLPQLAGRDKLGRPCIVVRPAHHIPNPQSVEDVINLTVYMLETSTALSRQHGDGYLCVIWEHTGTGYKNLDTGALLGNQGFITVRRGRRRRGRNREKNQAPVLVLTLHLLNPPMDASSSLPPSLPSPTSSSRSTTPSAWPACTSSTSTGSSASS